MNTATIVAEIDAEIARLKQARDLIAGVQGKVRGTAATSGWTSERKPTKRQLSPEARERIRQAQKKRWAALKKASPAKRSGSASS